MDKIKIANKLKIKESSITGIDDSDEYKAEDSSAYIPMENDYVSLAFADYYVEPMNDISTPITLGSTTINSSYNALEGALWVGSNNLNYSATLSDISFFEAKYRMTTQQFISAYRTRNYGALNNIDPRDIEKWMYLSRMYGFSY